MADAENPRAVIGDNKPPRAELLAAVAKPYIDRIAPIAARAENIPLRITTDEENLTIGGVVTDVRALTKDMEKAREAESKPHYDAWKETNAFFKVYSDQLDRIAERMQQIGDAFTKEKAAVEQRRREEEARKLREQEEKEREAAREAEIAAAWSGAAPAATDAVDRAVVAGVRADIAEREAQAGVADLTRARSETGLVASARGEWKGEITSMDEIDLNRLRPYLKRDDVQKALNAFVRTGARELKGARIFQDVKANYR